MRYDFFLYHQPVPGQVIDGPIASASSSTLETEDVANALRPILRSSVAQPFLPIHAWIDMMEDIQAGEHAIDLPGDYVLDVDYVEFKV